MWRGKWIEETGIHEVCVGNGGRKRRNGEEKERGRGGEKRKGKGETGKGKEKEGQDRQREGEGRGRKEAKNNGVEAVGATYLYLVPGDVPFVSHKVLVLVHATTCTRCLSSS